MSDLVTAAGRRLPRGWAHLGLQFAIWIGFYFLYQLARGLADHGGTETAFANGHWIIERQRDLHSMLELDLQRLVDSSGVLIQATSWTYWLSQFVVVAIALLWIYFRAHERFLRFRDTLIAANLIGLVGYVLVPTAPPRMFPGPASRTRWPSTRPSTIRARRWPSPRTRTRRCRACTPPTR